MFHERARHDCVRALFLSCGQCFGCRLERSRQWAIRCMHEAQMHDRNCYITLTYADEHLPAKRSLNYTHFQKFMKRLRKQQSCWDVTTGEPHAIRFYMCGEYGDEKTRPHFHACIFNHDFHDKTIFKKRKNADLYKSALLEKLWPYGYSTVGAVTFESAAYVARYVMKKITGDQAEGHYRGAVDETTGEYEYREPEFNHMSLRPGLGAKWLEQYAADVYPHGLVVINGKEVTPPKYYDKWIEKQVRLARLAPTPAASPPGVALASALTGDELEQLRENRAKQLAKGNADRTDERLMVRQAVAQARVAALKRTLK